MCCLHQQRSRSLRPDCSVEGQQVNQLIRRATIPLASAALARSCALGWRAVLAAHEAAWDARWLARDVAMEGDDESQRAVRFAIYHLTSAANPEDDRVSSRSS
jgi:trehalose/maltose hydrolase-like predicted phosphorylase